jgi:restriction endonuclease Mrr
MSRSTPDSSDIMPAVLDLLKRETELKKSRINDHMRTWIETHGFDQRDRSITWALNRLGKEDYVSNSRRGYWRVTPKGLSTVLSSEEAYRIMKKWTDFETARRRKKLSG